MPQPPSEYQYSLKAFDLHNVISFGNKGTIIKTSNSGLNWTEVSSGFRNSMFGVDFINENYGWTCDEGNHDYNNSRDCTTYGVLTNPKLEYEHGPGDSIGCSITGGYIYRGSKYPPLGAVRQALAAWANVSRLRFTEVADTAVTVGDLRFAYTHLPGTDVEEAQAWAYSPAAAPYGGDVWFNATGSSYFERWSPGTYSYLSSIHEIGHALGLKHPFEISQVGDETLNPTIIDPSLDSRSYTVMSYSAAPGDSSTYFEYEPTTLMVLDIAAVQALYGSNSGYKSGASSYVFQQSAQYHQTLWDAGGIDTISYISTEGGIVDLRAGTDFGSRLGRAIHVTDSAGNNLFAVNNIWIAYGTCSSR